MAVHETDIGIVRHAIHQLNHLSDLGVITETSLNGLTTVAGLLASFDSAVVSEQDSNAVRQAKIAIQKCANVGGLTDAQVNTAGAASGGSRYSTLIAAVVANDPNSTVSDRRTFAF